MLRQSGIAEIEDMLLKIIVIGDSSVGKSNIVLRFSEDQFKQNNQPTIGVDFKMQQIVIDKTKLKLQIWDTAGQQRYKSLSKTYYRGTCGIILVYSVIDEKSFENIQKWLKEVAENVQFEGQIVLVANKIDMQKQRKLSWGQGKQLAEKHNIKFIQVSARTGQRIDDLFRMLGASILMDIIDNDKGRKIKLRQSIINAKFNKCSNCSC